MSRSVVRVVHVPARTPYAWKLRSNEIEIVNGTSLASGEIVPAALGAAWLLAHRPFDWFDALHLHHIEFEDINDLGRLLDVCAAHNVRVVVTAHDVTPMFSTKEQLAQRFQLLSEAGAAWVFLTPKSASSVLARLARQPEHILIPHGYVVPPDRLANCERRPSGISPRYLLYGAIRPNRDHLSVLVNWRLGLRDEAARLHLLLRALSPVDFTDGKGTVLDIISTASDDPRITITMHPYPSDSEVAEAALNADALLLPYLWGSHSGQLELAFDLNLLPVCASTGFMPDQFEIHDGRVAEPVWFDWSSGLPYLYGERFLAALRDAHQRLRDRGPQRLDQDFLEYRREEHREILNAYAATYSGDQRSSGGR